MVAQEEKYGDHQSLYPYSTKFNDNQSNITKIFRSFKKSHLQKERKKPPKFNPPSECDVLVQIAVLCQLVENTERLWCQQIGTAIMFNFHSEIIYSKTNTAAAAH